MKLISFCNLIFNSNYFDYSYFSNIFNTILSLIIVFSCFLGFFRINYFFTSKNINIISKNKNISNNLQMNFSISVIIPVRNEEKRLPLLLENLINQTYKPLEIIVVDDGSQDRTKEVVEYYIKRENNLNEIKIIYFNIKDFDINKLGINNFNNKNYIFEILNNKFEKSLENWKGKVAACFFGAILAKGDFFLFFDADVRLKEDALKYISENISEDYVLSIQPYHLTYKPYEQFSLYSNLIVFLGLDIGKIKNPYETKVGLFGPCLIIPKEIYYKTGGHFLVNDTVLDDMALGIEFSKRKIKMFSIPHNNKIFFNMYPEGIKSLIDGWTKNMIVGAQKSTFWTILIIFSFITYSTSISINTISSIINFDIKRIIFYLFQYLIFSLLLYISSKKLGKFKFITNILFPIFLLFYLIIFLRSFLMKILKIPIYWRGRKILIK